MSTALKKKTSVISNCYWGITEDIAFEKLQKLKYLGLTKFSISYDEFHFEYVKPTCVKNVLKVCKKLGMPVTLGVVATPQHSAESTVQVLGTDLYNVPMYIYPCLPVGSAVELGEENFVRSVHKYDVNGCPHNGIMAVFFNKKVYPCCSQSVIETDLTIGEVGKTTLKESVKNLKTNGILYAIRNKGFRWLVKVAEESEIEVPEYVVNSCEMCSILFSKENIVKMIPKINEEMTNINRKIQNNAVANETK